MNGIKSTKSPLTIVIGSRIYHKNHCVLELGTYVVIHSTNICRISSAAYRQQPRIPLLCEPVFREFVTRNNLKELPIPKVILAVHQLTQACKKGIVMEM